MKKLAFALAVALGAGAALAKLPPLSDEAKAKADETKAKTAWSDKVAAYKLCLSQDKAAGNYRKVKGKDAKPAPASIPACQDPGPYVPATVAASSAPAAAPATAPASAVAKAGSAMSPPAKK